MIKWINIFFPLLLSQFIFAQQINYCPNNSQENACDLLSFKSINIQSIKGEKILSSSNLNCKENEILDRCTVLENEEQYQISIETMIDESLLDVETYLGYKIKAWLDFDADGEWAEDEILINSEVYSLEKKSIFYLFDLPLDIKNKEIALRIRAAIIPQNQENENFDACEYLDLAFTNDILIHGFSSCSPVEIDFNHEKGNSFCEHIFTPVINKKPCFQTFKYAWSISFEKENKSYEYLEGNVKPLKKNLDQIGLYEICLQVTEESPNGLICITHHCEKYWNDKGCEIINNGIKIYEPSLYPSLIENKLNIIFSNKIDGSEVIEIYDLNGKLIQSLIPESENIQIDVSAFSTGYFIVKIKESNNWHINKIFKVFDN